MHFRDDIIVGIDAAGNLAVGRGGGGSEEGECAEGEDEFFHIAGRLADEGEGASDEKTSNSGKFEILNYCVAWRLESAAVLGGEVRGVASAICTDRSNAVASLEGEVEFSGYSLWESSICLFVREKLS